ncbi:MAG: tRNA lysidine(34) synthetase TilS [Ruminococcaceae bacterium]|jgi:tRNA(Ile)-lysidine synthase|nr:tRNA lysidine(34) synthetase TilS [Oscillospiraceae bacterium]
MVRLDAAEELVRRFDMLPPGTLVLTAVSGGVDSISLLHWLHAHGVRVAAGHLHHGLRGEAADGDEAFVRDFCARLDVPFLVEHADVGALARELGVSTEEAGRKARYDFLARAARELGADRIATAHHADDNAETLLFQLLRGARSGLGGIAPVRGSFIRPFLGVTRAQIEAYAAENGLGHRLDAMNLDDAYARNYIRHEIMPRLRTVNAAAAEHMALAAQTLRTESEYLDEIAAARLREGGARLGETRTTVPCKTVNAAPDALRGRMVRLLLDALRVGKRDFTARHYDAIEKLCKSEYGTHLDLPHGVCAEKSGGVLTLCSQAEAEIYKKKA